MPDKVKALGEYTIKQFKTLKIIRAVGLLDIRQGTFADRTNLVVVDFPAVETIGNNAFSGCTSLVNVNLPKATNLDYNAFSGCTALVSLNLPAVKTIRDGVFSGCTRLVSLNVPELTGIGNKTFSGCTGLVDLNFPKAASIGQYAFNKCTALGSLNLPAAANIGDNVFFETGAKPLTLNLPAKAPAFGSNSSASAGYAKNVLINRPVNNTGYDGAWITAFKKLFGAGADIALIGNPAFFTLKPPFTSMQSAEEYMEHMTILGDPRGRSPDNPLPLQMQIHLSGASSFGNLLVAIASKKKYVALDLSLCSMNGTEFDLRTPSSTGRTYLAGLILPNAAESIKDIDFDYVHTWANWLRSLKTVSGSNVKTIGRSAFNTCMALTTVDFPKAQTIKHDAFSMCTALTTVKLPQVVFLAYDNNPEDPGAGAFESCSALTTLDLPNAEYIGATAFASCFSLTTLNLPKVKYIDWHAFDGLGYRSHQYLTITMPQNAPGLFPAVEFDSEGKAYPVTVTIKRPRNSTGYDAKWWYNFKKLFSYRNTADITLRFQDL
jgi:hypothetical protein